jgi:predicted acylesterase/phospholipase RssA
MTTGPVASSRAPVLVDFALQGGGAHGAFTWGVLDRLLEEPWLGIDGISGTSAGAISASSWSIEKANRGGWWAAVHGSMQACRISSAGARVVAAS